MVGMAPKRTASGAEMFRVFGAAAAAPKLQEALLAGVGRRRTAGANPSDERGSSRYRTLRPTNP